MIPTEIVIHSTRSYLQNPETGNQDLADDLNVINELKDSKRIRMAAYQQRITKSYNKTIRVIRFQMGDLLLRKAFQNTTDSKDGKLAPKWVGPYNIEAEAGKGTYKLSVLDGRVLPRSWNVVHLKLYFV
ncbi:uncharacterized protein LOC143576002 [Bidens hawaiensis]|uniref:uncharacterized protein LOC143576002 n=1 Tax=Bidens hawaiensis TaxID=980011 RepID=UPI00404A5E4B